MPPCGYSDVIFEKRLFRLPWAEGAPMMRCHHCVVSWPRLKQAFPNHQLSLTAIGPPASRCQALSELGVPCWVSRLKEKAHSAMQAVPSPVLAEQCQIALPALFWTSAQWWTLDRTMLAPWKMSPAVALSVTWSISTPSSLPLALSMSNRWAPEQVIDVVPYELPKMRVHDATTSGPRLHRYVPGGA